MNEYFEHQPNFPTWIKLYCYVPPCDLLHSEGQFTDINDLGKFAQISGSSEIDQFSPNACKPLIAVWLFGLMIRACR